MSARSAGLTAVLLTALATAGCSGDSVPTAVRSSPSTPSSGAIPRTNQPTLAYPASTGATLSPVAYRRASTQLCNAEQKQVLTAESEYDTSGYPESFPSRNFVAYLQATTRITRELRMRLGQLPVPAGGAGEVDAYLGHLEALLHDLHDLETAAAGTSERAYRGLAQGAGHDDPKWDPTKTSLLTQSCTFFSAGPGAGN